MGRHGPGASAGVRGVRPGPSSGSLRGDGEGSWPARVHTSRRWTREVAAPPDVVPDGAAGRAHGYVTRPFDRAVTRRTGNAAWRDTRVLRCPVRRCVRSVPRDVCRSNSFHLAFTASQRTRHQAWVPTRRRFCETDDNERYPLMSNSRTRLVLTACVACGTVLSTAARSAVTASAATPLTIARAAERS